jgi:tetratricopeptide (TPR) repeat protein
MTTNSQTINEQTWAKTFSAGIAALDAGSFKNATKDLETAVDIAGQLGLTEPLTNSLLALGDAQRLSGQYQKAEKTFQRAIDFSFKHPEGKRIPYAFSLGALGRLYIEQNRIDQARDLLEMAVSMLRHHRASAEPEFLTVFLALITCYLEQQEFEKADKLSRYTYDLSKALVGPADAATLMAMTMCAVSAKALGKQRRADILRCQIRTIMQDRKKKGACDELGIAASMMRQLNREGVVDTRPIVFDFGGEEIVFERDIPTFGDSSTSKSNTD